ncbi:unnamed protein product [Rotaria magnacalcarata]
MHLNAFLVLLVASLFSSFTVTSGLLCTNPGRYSGEKVYDYYGKIFMSLFIAWKFHFIFRNCTGDGRPTSSWRPGTKFVTNRFHSVQQFSGVAALVSLVSVTSGIACINPSRYSGQTVCDPFGRKCGECVSFVKKCTGDERKTSQWRQGRKVRDASISSGTAIATFPDGAYSGHAAIYMGQDHNGIHVWDQWRGHPVSQRIIHCL